MWLSDLSLWQIGIHYFQEYRYFALEYIFKCYKVLNTLSPLYFEMIADLFEQLPIVMKNES